MAEKIKEKNSQDDILNATLKEIRKQFAKSSIFTKPDCQNCWAKYHCSGGCAANNANFNGDINKPYEITCEMMKERMQCAMHLYSQKKTEN